MRVFRPIVQTFVLTMLDTGQHLLLRCALAPQLIRDQHTRDVLTALEQLSEELLGGLLVPATLHQYIQHVPVLINSPPQIVLFPVDGEEDLIEMPRITGLCPPPAQLVRVVLAKCAAPLPDRLIREDDPARCQQFFYVAIAEGESILEPHGLTDNLGREAVALVRRRGCGCCHATDDTTSYGRSLS
jgi:hypothetical protein